MTDVDPQPCWDGGPLPPSVRVGANTRINGQHAFRRISASTSDALVIGSNTTLDGVQFSIGLNARITIGNYCCFTAAVIMSEHSITIGHYVLIGFNVVIADSDFHPMDPAARIADAMACSPAGGQRVRPAVAAAPVVVENDVWIGPGAVIFKGVHIGRGAWIAPGSMVTRDVPAGWCVGGNPVRPMELPT